MTDQLDAAIRSIDPTNGTLPTSETLQSRSVVSGLQSKLAAYNGLLSNAMINRVPMDSVPFSEIKTQTAFLPNVSYFRSSSILDRELGIDFAALAQPPHACVRATPTAGGTSTSFNFNAGCSTDNLFSVRDLQFQWDFDNNGVWDGPWSMAPSLNGQFTSVGQRIVKVRMQDPALLISQTSVSVLVDNPPHACFDIDRTSVAPGTAVNFDAACSWDDVMPSATLKVRWDFEDDGSWDTAWTTSKAVSRQYWAAGAHTVRLAVQNDAALESATTRVVYVDAGQPPPPSSSGGGCRHQGVDAPNSRWGPTPNGVLAGSTGGGGGCAQSIHPESSKRATRDDVAYTPLGVPAPGRDLAEVFLLAGATTPALDPSTVLFQRSRDGDYEPAKQGEVLYWLGQRIRFHPTTPPVAALVQTVWLAALFGTYGSSALFAVTRVHGRDYALVSDANVLGGFVDAFNPIVLGASTLYTAGKTDMVQHGHGRVRGRVLLARQPGPDGRHRQLQRERI
jgi:PKD repeat protein